MTDSLITDKADKTNPPLTGPRLTHPSNFDVSKHPTLSFQPPLRQSVELGFCPVRLYKPVLVKLMMATEIRGEARVTKPQRQRVPGRLAEDLLAKHVQTVPLTAD